MGSQGFGKAAPGELLPVVPLKTGLCEAQKMAFLTGLLFHELLQQA